MAGQKATSEDLTQEQLRKVYADSGEAEKKLMSDLAKTKEPNQAAIVAELLHYFPGAKLTDAD